MITIDGLTFDVPCTIERVAEIKASEISGTLLDKSYFNDVVGTYMSYSVTLAVQLQRGGGDDSTYYRLYEALTDPVDAHSLTMPYNGGTVGITARVEKVNDVLVTLPGQREFWKGIQFEAIAVHPTKTYTLSEALNRGFAPLPDFGNVQVGDMYTFTSNGWVLTEYDDADLKAY